MEKWLRVTSHLNEEMFAKAGRSAFAEKTFGRRDSVIPQESTNGL